MGASSAPGSLGGAVLENILAGVFHQGRRPQDGGRREAETHSAAALRRDDAVDALLQHAGILRFTSGEELFNAAEFFEGRPLPTGRRVGIVSNSTGVATFAADACATRGLVVGQVHGQARNPLVLGIHASAEHYAEGIRTMLEDAGVDAVMANYVDLAGGDPQAVLEAISDAAAGQPKPLRAAWRELERRVQAAGRPWTGTVVQPLVEPERTCSWARSGIPNPARSWRSAWAAARPAPHAPSRSACCR